MADNGETFRSRRERLGWFIDVHQVESLTSLCVKGQVQCTLSEEQVIVNTQFHGTISPRVCQNDSSNRESADALDEHQRGEDEREGDEYAEDEADKGEHESGKDEHEGDEDAEDEGEEGVDDDADEAHKADAVGNK